MTVRGIIRMRDGCDNEDFDDMLDEFEDCVADGTDPEEAMAEVFGLEPDYIMEDREIWARVEAALSRG